MDVQLVELRTGISTRPPARRPEPHPATARERTRQSPAGDGGGIGPVAAHATAHRALLLAYTAASISSGLAALVWTTLTVPILPAIDPGLTGTSLARPEGGLMLWIAFGLVGSLRVLPIPGSSAVWTFHFPFVAAAMVLGGPTAGAWVGFLATVERRELESGPPWYGALANHAVLALGAVVGGLTVLVVDGALRAVLPDPGAARLVAIASGTLVLAVVVDGIAAGTIMLRERLAPIALVDIVLRSFGRVTLAEIGLAWVFVVAWVAVGWWAPLALAVVVLLVWPAEGLEGVDPLMRLPRMRQFQRELDAVLSRSRRGLAPGGLLLMIDLDGFGQLNKDHGMQVGDEVLAEIGSRLRGLVRITDIAGRLGGDELALFYGGVIDLPTARGLAAGVERAIRQPVATSIGVVRVGVSIGALVVRPSPDIPARATLMHWADRVMQEQKKAQKAGRSRTGVRFHPYGTRTASPRGGGERIEEPAVEPRAAAHAERLMRRAALVAGAIFAIVLAAWVLRMVA
jgi:diguanylate cyclase (GGDEF)-like protein